MLEDISQANSSVLLQGDAYTSEYSSWEEAFSTNGFDASIGQSWDAAAVLFEALILPDVHINETVLSPSFAWKKQKILVFDTLDADIQNALYDSGWFAMDIHTDPNQLRIKLQERS